LTQLSLAVLRRAPHWVIDRAPHWALDAVIGSFGALAAISMAHAALPSVKPKFAPARPVVQAQRLAAAVAAPPMFLKVGYPVTGYPIISPFGLRQLPWEEHGRLHAGVDIAAPAGSPVLSVADGVVTRAGEDGGFGRFVEVRQAGGLVSIYAHLGSIQTHAGALIRGGEQLGRIGSTGSSTGAHLHFEIRDRDDHPLNPTAFFDQSFATAEALPIQVAGRIPRHVRIAYVSFIPQTKRELMEAREADKAEAELARIETRRAAEEAKAVAANRADFPGAQVATDRSAPTAAPVIVAPAKRAGRVHATLEMEG
jgi:hypothetical protein